MSSQAAQANSKMVLKLYKEILKHGKVFPSIKRDKIVKEIKFEFRANRALSDPVVIKKKVDLAVQGLKQMSMYTNLPKNSSKWEINLDTNAFPDPKL